LPSSWAWAGAGTTRKAGAEAGAETGAGARAGAGLRARTRHQSAEEEVRALLARKGLPFPHPSPLPPNHLREWQRQGEEQGSAQIRQPLWEGADSVYLYDLEG
jgi:hypothetical protein